MQYFNPNDIGNINNNIFGLPFNEANASIVFIPVPWDVTVSYGAGTANAPEAIFDASFQVDLFDPFKENAWETAYAMCAIPSDIKEKNERLKYHSRDIITHLANGDSPGNSAEIQNSLDIVNTGCEELNSWVKNKSKEYLDKKKL